MQNDPGPQRYIDFDECTMVCNFMNRRGQPLDTVQNLGKYVHISSMEIPSAYTSLRVSCSLSAPSVFLSGL